MTDIALHESNLDIALFAGDLVPDESLRTALLVSLFSDREVPGLFGGERRGWWGDALANADGDRIGSRLWTLRREKLTANTAQRVKEAVQECMAWLVDDGIARQVQVTTEIQKPDRLATRIELFRTNGQRELVRFAVPWSASFAASQFEQNVALANRFTELAALYEFEYFIHYPELVE